MQCNLRKQFSNSVNGYDTDKSYILFLENMVTSLQGLEMEKSTVELIRDIIGNGKTCSKEDWLTISKELDNVKDVICPKCGTDTSHEEKIVLRSCSGCGITYAVKRHPR